jgi:N-acetyl-beta-hexosaminidase
MREKERRTEMKTQKTTKLHTNESYELSASSTAASATSSTDFGAMYALETFSQLLVYSPSRL